ncbi:MAG: ribosome rescue protein RqcH [Sulfolobales archaeon]|nr:NFACT family protein [Sulfolobales archaeon]MCX8186250.1 ribosome rescue protein RqcH [Sulfolobales archaeon]MDW7969014.1 ribosome rescue protein RqcH [Sulfolobales archaeon]
MRAKDTSVKKAFTSLDLAVIVEELRRKIVGTYVDNVYVDALGSIVMKLRTHEEALYLLLKPAERIHVIRRLSKLDVLGRTTLFRRYLNNLRILNIKQVGFERIAVLELEGGDGVLSLYLELIPRGIVTLVNSGNKVLVTSKELKVKDRKVITGRGYTLPPTYRDFRELSTGDWVEILSKYDNILRGLVRGLGIPPEVANEVLKSWGGGDVISEDVVSEIRSRLIHFVNRVIEKPEPCIIAKGGSYVSFLPFKPSKLEEGLDLLTFQTFNEAVDEYFHKLFTSEVVTQDSKLLEEEIAKVDRIIKGLEDELRSYNDRLMELKAIHDLITLNYAVLDDVYRCVWNTVKRHGWEHISSCGISTYNKSDGTFIVKVDGTPIELNVREGINDYLIKVKMQIKELEDKVRKVKEVREGLYSKRGSLILEKESLSAPPLSKKVDWYDKYHWIITSEGYLALGGKDFSQNEKLVRKYLGDDDVFMHADISGASVFILKSSGRTPLQSTLLEVATLAACYSRGWKEGLGSLDVFWVLGRQVSKKPPSGEYLAPGSFMVYGEKNYVKNVKLELAIGVLIVDNNYYKLLVGPDNYVSSRCSYYAVLNPGTDKKELVAKRLREFFIKSDRRLRYIDLNELILRIPGPSRITKLVAPTIQRDRS